jgi:hypothetical protein
MLALLLAASLAAPVPKVKETDLYWPTKEGTKRVMEVTTAGGNATETTETVTKVATKDGASVVTVERTANGKAVAFEYTVSGEGVARRQPGDTGSVDQFKPEAGATWATQNPGSANTTYTVGKPEEVEVPAGKSKAIPVVSEFDLGCTRLKSTSWYAPGVGLVKQTIKGQGTDQTSVLKEFTPGK